MHIIQATNNNDAYCNILKTIKEHGVDIESRGLKYKEIYPVLIKIENPKDNLITNKERQWSEKVAKAEFWWYMSGSNLLKDIVDDMPMWAKFSDDGVHIRSAYGYRWYNQLPDIIRKFREDLYTRKAVISLYDGIEDIGYSGKDTVCTLTIQFIYRNNKMDMLVNMRSNDLIWGFCNDAYSFTMLHKLISSGLNVEQGEYYHYVASMHIYERHYHLLGSV
jgi:thymidylate synthase